MKTSELIKQAEELLAKSRERQWTIHGDDPMIDGLNCRNFIIINHNHMQELVDRLKRCEVALKLAATEIYAQDEGDSSCPLFPPCQDCVENSGTIAALESIRKALEEE